MKLTQIFPNYHQTSVPVYYISHTETEIFILPFSDNSEFAE